MRRHRSSGSRAWRLRAGQLLVTDRGVDLGGHRSAVLQRRPVDPPLPELRAADLGGGGVLHQVVDRGRAVAGQPRGEILEATLTLVRTPASVTRPPATSTFSSSAAVTMASGRRSFWFGRSPRTPSKISRASGTRSGWATHVPSEPSPDSRSLSIRTWSSAFSVTSGSRRFGMKAPCRRWRARRAGGRSGPAAAGRRA